MRRSADLRWMCEREAQAGKWSDIVCGLLVLLMLLVPAVLTIAYLYRVASGEAAISYTNVDPMLFRVTGLG